MANEAAQKARQNIYYNKHWYDPRYWNDIAYLAQQLADTCTSNQAIIQHSQTPLGGVRPHSRLWPLPLRAQRGRRRSQPVKRTLCERNS